MVVQASTEPLQQRVDSLRVRRLSGSTAGCSRHCSPSTKQLLSQPSLRRCKKRRLLIQRVRQMIAAGAAAAVPVVRVVTKDSLRVKRISAEVQVQASIEQVWKVLTGYSTLADFVPNLDLCERISGAPPGRQRLRQRACSQSLFWRLQAEAILDVQEVCKTAARRELRFTMVEGDFQEFSGRWIVEPDPSVLNQLATLLRYEVSIVPKWSLPSTLVTTIVRCGLPANVRAIATQAEKLAQKRRGAPKFASAAFSDNATLEAWSRIPQVKPAEEETLPTKGPVRTPADLPEVSKLRLSGTENLRKYLGLSSVPLPFPRRGTADIWEKVLPTRRDRQKQEPNYQRLQHGWVGGDIPLDQSIEVHLRKLDDTLTLHRRVVASISIRATAAEVWNVLTDYEKLPEFVPNLLLSQRQETPPGAPDRLIRLRQVGHKSFMYMHLYAEATLAIVETLHKEIQFKQIMGDFQTLQGKIMLQQDGPEKVTSHNQESTQTTLKYAIEVEVPQSNALLGVMDPLLERIVYQDIPANLSSVKDRVAQLRQGKIGPSQAGKEAEMMADFSALESELLETFGDHGPLPKLSTLQKMHRQDLEQAIHAHGGLERVAELMGWSIKGRKPSPWFDLDSTREAFDAFAREEGLAKHFLPNRDMLIRLARKDMLKGADEWGGIEELAELLEYQVAGDLSLKSDVQRHISADTVHSLAEHRRPKPKELCESFAALAEELRSSFGPSGPLPSSTELRSMKRFDLSKAISHHGGGSEVSKRLGWKQTYRPPNYWGDVENCKAELDKFCHEIGAPLGVVPSVYSMQQAGRHDLSRAVRHWGGLSKLADALGYKIPENRAEASNQKFRDSKKPSIKEDHKSSSTKKMHSKSSREVGNGMRNEIDSW